MRLVWGTVREVLSEAPGIQRLEVEPDDGGGTRAICYTSLTGGVLAGERVLLNTTAVELALGTGGTHFVVARGEAAGAVALDAPSGGHVMKLRYTPHQRDVVSVEAPESPHHHVMAQARSLEGVPVVCCGLHSQMPLVAAAVKSVDPNARIAYCMTDHASLMLALSDVTRACLDVGLVDTTVTCGQSTGGHLEAVNLHSGLLAAVHVAHADVVIVAIGPGVVGTATPFGHGGVAQGEALNAVAALGGDPIACLRISFADARERHRGVSHHSLTSLAHIATAPVTIAVPELQPEFFDAIEQQLAHVGPLDRHTREIATVPVDLTPALRGVSVSSMGRGLDQDPAFFAAAFAAGNIALRHRRSVL